MTTKEIAEMVYGKPVEYKTKEYSSISRSLNSLEKRGLIKRVQVQLRWRLKTKQKLGWSPRITFKELVAEMVRETVFQEFHEEIPYSVFCQVEEFRESQDPIYIQAHLFVERKSSSRRGWAARPPPLDGMEIRR